MPGGPNPRRENGHRWVWRLSRALARDWRPPSPPHQRSRRKGTHLPPCPPIMPTQCARRVWPRGGRGLQGPFLSPGVLSTAAAPSFSELLLLGRRLPLPAAGTQASPAPIPEPAELETRHSPGERGRGPAGRLRPSFRGAPRKAAAPPRRSGPSSLPAPAPPSLGAALRSCWGRWAGTRAGASPTSVLEMPHALHCPPVESRGGGRSTAHPHLPHWTGRECV